MKILVTGGSGFIGRYLCRDLQKNDIDFFTLSSSPCPSEFEEKSKIVELQDYELLFKVINDYEPDTIIHLAAIASPVHDDIIQIYKVNVCGTENLLKAAANLRVPPKIILISTAGVYGNHSEPLLNESTNFNPANHYCYSKMVTEVMSRQYTDIMDICILRPFNVIGSGQSENFLIPKLVKAFSNKDTHIKLGNLNAVRDYVSVEFCSRFITDLAIGNLKFEPIINICTGIGHSCKDVFNILVEISGYEPKIITEDNLIRKNEVWNLVGNPSLINSVIGGRYKSPSLEDILTSMLKQYQNT